MLTSCQLLPIALPALKRSVGVLFLLLLLNTLAAQDWANLNKFQKDNAVLMASDSDEQRIVFMGNSITEGWSDIRPEFFVGKSYINRGISGQTTPQMLLRFRQDVIDLNPFAVVILAGINDIAGNTGPSTIEMIFKNITSMVELARSNDIEVILCSVLPAYDFPWRPGLEPAEKVVKLNALLKAYAQQQNISYVDYFTPMANEINGLKKELGSDGVHPNAAGYLIMEPILEKAISTLLTTKTMMNQEKTIPLWSGEIPYYQSSDEVEVREHGDILWITKVQEPTLEIYLPSKRTATGKAMVICPGGGYEGLAYDWEGTDIAKWLNSKGIAAFVLKYRMPQAKSVTLSHKAPLLDAKRAIRIVRQHAEEWNIAKDQVGIIGFSAGGHLASTLGTHYAIEDELTEQKGEDTFSARPDFMVLVYPVITMNSAYTHQGSKNNLLGQPADQELTDFYSTELHVTKDTPPTFIVHSADDEAVPVMNSLLFYQALQKEAVYSEMHLYPKGGHGYALAVGQGHLATWGDRLVEWLDSLQELHK